VDEAMMRVGSARARPRAGVRAYTRHSRTERVLFVFSLLLFGFSSVYTATVMLARVYPALFPGQTLPLTRVPGLGSASSAIGISNPDEDSVFNRRINMLILGVDKRPGYRDEGNLTDTIMIASLDPVSKTTNLLSLPRDMLIDVHTPTGTYQTRINESYGIGFRAGGGFDAGIEQVKTDLLENFGIEIDHAVLLDFKGVEKLIDALDGVDVDIPYELTVPQWWYSDDDINGRYIFFGSGPQHLNGYHAVAFGRYREDSDFYRVKRQQLVVEAAVKKIFARGLLQNPFDLWDAYSGAVKTDLSKTRMIQLAPLARQTQGRTKTFSLADPVNGRETMTGILTAGGASVQKWDAENVQYWLSQVFTKAQYVESSVEIQNGYGEDGAVRASALGRFLAYSKGLPTVYVGPDSPVQPTTTLLLYSSNKRDLAEDVAKWMGIPSSAIKVMPRTDDALPDVVIVIGKDFKIPG